MRKVIFEQVGNIILGIILVIAACQTISSSTFRDGQSGFYFDIHLDAMWGILLMGIIVFSIARRMYAKRLGAEDGYTEKAGELSANDEREKMIGEKAATLTYRGVSYYLAILLPVLIFGTILIDSALILRMVAVIGVGSIMIFSFTLYLIVWCRLDQKL